MSATELNSAGASSVPAEGCCPEPADWSALAKAVPPATVGCRFTVWHQRLGRQAVQAQSPVFQAACSDGPARVEELEVCGDWIGVGGVLAALVIHCQPILRQRQPTREEREADAALVLEVAVEDSEGRPVKVCEVRPGGSQPIINPAGPVLLRCPTGAANVAVTQVPV